MMTRLAEEREKINMGIAPYQQDGKTWYRLDTRVKLPDGRLKRIIETAIPSKDLALRLLDKVRSDAIEGRLGGKAKAPRVDEVWKLFEPTSRRMKRSWERDRSLAAHLSKHLGSLSTDKLTIATVERYRAARELEPICGHAPSVATINRELTLLRRMLNYAVACEELKYNPLARLKLVKEDNTRSSVVDEAGFQKLLEAADDYFKPILITAFDTGMRKAEIMKLEWSQVDLTAGRIRLEGRDTKSREPRLIVMTERLCATLKEHRKGKVSSPVWVFLNPETGAPWVDLKRPWTRACEKAGLPGLWFHDLRRSFVTNMRKAGVPESVCMKLSGHKTRAVFERYNIIDSGDLEAAIRAMENARSKAI
jgi:integrase